MSKSSGLFRNKDDSLTFVVFSEMRGNYNNCKQISYGFEVRDNGPEIPPLPHPAKMLFLMQKFVKVHIALE